MAAAAAARGNSLPLEPSFMDSRAATTPRCLHQGNAYVHPQFDIHPHGHRRGSHTESIGDSGSGSTTAVPAATQQNSFSSMLQSLEQAIGMRSSTTASAAGTASVAATGASSAAGAGTSANTLAAAAAAGTASASSVSTLLRNYLNNLSHTLPVDGSPTPKAGASNVSISV
jgi:hypothetical protein